MPHNMIILNFGHFIFMSQIVFLHCILVLAFYIHVVITLSGQTGAIDRPCGRLQLRLFPSLVTNEFYCHIAFVNTALNENCVSRRSTNTFLCVCVCGCGGTNLDHRCKLQAGPGTIVIFDWRLVRRIHGNLLVIISRCVSLRLCICGINSICTFTCWG